MKLSKLVVNKRSSNFCQQAKNSGNKETIRRGALMKMLLNCAQTLPLWIGNSMEKPPPLCGAIAPEQNYVAKVGSGAPSFRLWWLYCYLLILFVCFDFIDLDSFFLCFYWNNFILIYWCSYLFLLLESNFLHCRCFFLSQERSKVH